MDVSTTGMVGLAPLDGPFAESLGCGEKLADWVGLEALLEGITLGPDPGPQSPLAGPELSAGARSLQSDSQTRKAPVLGSTATYYQG